ncbi:hypothetical protein D3C73_815320 [compost metagenome]
MRKRLEGIGIAKEVRYADQQIPEQGARFLRRLAQEFQVAVQRFRLVYLHAAMHAAHEGLAFIAAEIVAGPGQQQFVDLCLDGFHFRGQGAAVFIRGHRAERHVEIGGQLAKSGAHLGGGHGKVDNARADGAARHFGIGRPLAVGRLGHGDAAEFLDGLQAQGAVGVAAGQNDAHRALALVFGK